METRTNAEGAELSARANSSVTGTKARRTTTLPEAGQTRRLRDRAGWHFTRHLLEMLAAMGVGMGLLGLALWLFGEPPGYDNLLVQYGAMGVFMAAPMVAWMRYRGHSWRDGWEMAAAMLVPMFALVLPVEMGSAALSDDSLMMLSHVAMIGGMVALMIYRWDRYTHGPHDH
jgi:hypothetical protein